MVAEFCVGGISATDSGPLGSTTWQHSFWKQKTPLQIQGYIQYCFSGQFFHIKEEVVGRPGKRCPNVTATCHVSFCKVWFSRGSN